MRLNCNIILTLINCSHIDLSYTLKFTQSGTFKEDNYQIYDVYLS